jgi:hypothetical protein
MIVEWYVANSTWWTISVLENQNGKPMDKKRYMYNHISVGNPSYLYVCLPYVSQTEYAWASVLVLYLNYLENMYVCILVNFNRW